MWTLRGMKLLSCSYVVSFAKNCWQKYLVVSAWSFRGPQRQLKTQKKAVPVHCSYECCNQKISQFIQFMRTVDQYTCHRNQRLIPPQRFNLFFLGLLIKVNTCTYHASYNVCSIGSTRKSLYLHIFTYCCSTKTSNHSSIVKYTSPTDIAGVYLYIYIYIYTYIYIYFYF